MLVEYKDLHTYFKSEKGMVKALNGVSFSMEKNEILALVGESGSGKSVTALELMGLINTANSFSPKGEIWFEGENILELSKEEKRKIRGKEISMIFQEPMTSLNPALKIGYQMAEIYRKHFNQSKAEAKKNVLEMLEKVEMPRVEDIYKSYPHQLSGGQRQRVMIAMALSSNPKLLIADEPTTALDVTIQAQILDLMKNLKEQFGTSILFITHDLGVVAEIADNIAVMYSGKIVEKGKAIEVFTQPLHPYTKGLLQARPLLHTKQDKLFNIEGSVPNPIYLEENCYFADRCPDCMKICREKIPPEVERKGHKVSCFLYDKGMKV